MPIILPTADEYERMLSIEQRRRAVKRLVAAAQEFDDIPKRAAAEWLERINVDSADVIMRRRWVLEHDFGDRRLRHD
jgi:hypothetical protein